VAELTEKQQAILSTLLGQGPMTPTEIGEANGKEYHQASAWASAGLRALEKKGLVTRAPITPGAWEAVDGTDSSGEK
jgi:DNA-binding MarR family transcriptional regulator